MIALSEGDSPVLAWINVASTMTANASAAQYAGKIRHARRRMNRVGPADQAISGPDRCERKREARNDNEDGHGKLSVDQTREAPGAGIRGYEW